MSYTAACESIYEAYPGDTWVCPLTYTCLASDGLTKVPQDLTGYTFAANLLVGAKPPIPVTVSPQGTGNLLSAGQVQVVVPGSITANVPVDVSSIPGVPQNHPVRVQVIATDPAEFSKSVVFPVRVRGL